MAYGEPVHHIMQFDPADPGYLYLMTSHQMARVKVAACAMHATCRDCVGAADAYCGWCALETRCTLQQDCANSSQPHFWTSASEGPGHCPTMTVLPAKIDVHQEYPVSLRGARTQLWGQGMWGAALPSPGTQTLRGGNSYMQHPRDLEANGENSNDQMLFFFINTQ